MKHISKRGRSRRRKRNIVVLTLSLVVAMGATGVVLQMKTGAAAKIISVAKAYTLEEGQADKNSNVDNMQLMGYLSKEFMENPYLLAIMPSRCFHDYYHQDQAETTVVADDTDDDQVGIENIQSFIEQNDKKTVFDKITGKDDSVEKVYLSDTSSYNVDAVKSRSSQLDVNYLCQLPELPTGCEITSLTTVLNYFGYSVSKETMADNYLPQCGLAEGSFWHYFIGNPRDEYSYGCYAEPIVTAANSYLSEQGNKHAAYNVSNSDFSDLLNDVADGNPVVLWATIGMSPGYKTASWQVNGETVQWTAPEHCVVMTGYDIDAGTVTISDPLRGIVSYDLDTVISRYTQMHSQAVVIKSTTQSPDKPKDKDANPQEPTTVAPEPTTPPATQPTTPPATQPTTPPVTQPTTSSATQPTKQTTPESTPESETTQHNKE